MSWRSGLMRLSGWSGDTEWKRIPCRSPWWLFNCWGRIHCWITTAPLQQFQVPPSKRGKKMNSCKDFLIQITTYTTFFCYGVPRGLCVFIWYFGGTFSIFLSIFLQSKKDEFTTRSINPDGIRGVREEKFGRSSSVRLLGYTQSLFPLLIQMVLIIKTFLLVCNKFL